MLRGSWTPLVPDELKVHAAAPFESPRNDEEISWIDLDLDFDIEDGGELAIRDEASSTNMPARWATR